MKPLYLTRFALLTAIVLGCALSSIAQTTTYSTPSSTPVTYTIPAGVTAIGVDMAGAQGGNSYSTSYAGGKGGRVQCSLAVTAGQVLNIYVGGTGAVGSGCCGLTTRNGGVGGSPGGSGKDYGGGGGGSSDIRVGGTAISNRVVVAGGGGGGSAYCGDNGGPGGGLTGGNGSSGCGFSSSYYGSGGTQSSGGAGSGIGPGGAGTQAAGGTAYCCYYYGAGGGGGYWGGGGSYGAGGGGGSSFADAVLGTNVTHTQGYQSANGYVTICVPNVGIIIGNTPVCVGTTLTLTGTGSGGVWSSSNANATVGSSSGLVTGVSAGLATITYSVNVPGCGSGYVTATVTVNPAPAAISGTPQACPLTTTTLSDAGGGTWTSSNPTLATVGSSTGVVTGIASGSVTITYTLPTGCKTTLPVVINPLPAAITGTATLCAAGGTTSLGDASPGGSWISSTPGVATVAGTGVVTGIAAGTAIITYTLPTTCAATAVVTVNPLPSAITGTSTVCVAATTTLSDVGSGTWSSANSSIAVVGVSTGVVTGVSAGTTNISYTLSSTGCSISTPVLVNPIPAPITGTASVCVGGTTTLSDVTAGGVWTSSSLTFASVVPGTGAVTGIAAGTANISYTLGTGCSVSRSLLINGLPTAFSVTGGGGYCVGTSGVHVGLSFGSSGVTYKLYNGATLVSSLGGSNSGLDFGLQTTPGTYTVTGTDGTTGCVNNMAGSTTITINPLPGVFAVSGGGNFCAGSTGVHVVQSGSELGVNYQLYVGGVSTGAPAMGTGSAIDFGPQTISGTYTAVATNPGTGCTINMTGSASVNILPAPTVYNLNAGGGYCAGSTGIDIILNGSDASASYQLYLSGAPSGSPMTGTGSPLHFGMHTSPGVYTVVATNPATTCTSNMAGSTTIAVNPLPIAYTVTGGGTYCAGGTGVHIGLSFSNTGINYQLYRSSIPVGSPMSGSNASLDFGLQTTAGTYTVVAIDQVSGCTRNMTGSVAVSTTPVPNAFTVTGGGSYCAGGAGLHVGLSGSNTGIHYQLFNGITPVGTAVSGTGSALDFGVRTATGTYTVVATNPTTSCTNNMTGSATISVNPLPTVYSVIGSGTSYCAGGTGIDVSLSGSDVGIRYQLFKGGTTVGAPMTGTGLGLDFGNQMAAGTYTITGTDMTTGCSIGMIGSVVIVVNPLPTAYTVTGGGSYCSGGIGVHIGLSGSSVGVNYQLFNSGGAVGGPVAGLGSAIDFGFNTTIDVYNVVATDVITGCFNSMTGTATVAENPLPPVHLVTGGGNYCYGGSGIDIGLDGSESGIMYQLMIGTSPSGSSMSGSGSPLDFGNRTPVGTYTVLATDPSTSCTNTMTGDAIVGTNPLPTLYNVTGGGIYCAPGGSGVNVNLAGSEVGINYSLYFSGSPLDTIAGTGGSIGFGLQAGVGSYNVKATNTVTGCSANMTGSATVSTNPQPTVETVIGGGGYCVGGTGRNIGLGATDAGIHYQLYNGGIPVGTAMTGAGVAINFGSQTAPGTYTVVASPGGVCQTTMTGSATISINPLPNAYTLTGGGTFCAGGTGVDVRLSGSDNTVKYQLYVGTTVVGSLVTGTGSALDFGLQTAAGTYTVIATDTVTTCSTTRSSGGSVAINTTPAPNVYNTAGGGGYCAGGTGVHVTLAGSSTNVNYQLYNNGTAVGTAMAGTGTLLDFGLQTVAGAYTIKGTDAATSCMSNMADTATVSINPILTPVVTVTAHPGLNIVTGQRDTLDATATSGGGTNPTYQWLVNGFPVSGATNSRFISHNFADHDSVTCLITSSGDCGGITSHKSVIINVRNTTGVLQVTASDINVSVVPNPNKGIFSVIGSLGTNDDEQVVLEVTDLLGHVIYNGKITARNGNVDEKIQINNVANGMYILSLRSESGSKVFHVVIEQ